MSWIRVDDLIVIHAKWWGLSLPAKGLAFMALAWCGSPNGRRRPGFLSEAQLRACAPGVSKRKFDALVDELVTAGAPAHESGILVREDGGYRVHDFEHYSAPSAPREPTHPAPPDRPKLSRQDAARLAGQASAAKRRETHGTAQPPRTPSSVPPNVVSNVLERSSPNVVPNEPIQPTERLPESPDPLPERTTTNVQDTEANRAERRSGPVVVDLVQEERRELTPCPADLVEQCQGRGILRLAADELDVPIWDVEAEARNTRDYWTVGRGMGGLKRDWFGYLRERLGERHRQGRLLGVGSPPGEREHGERVAAERRAAPPSSPRGPRKPTTPLEPVDMGEVLAELEQKMASGGRR